MRHWDISMDRLGIDKYRYRELRNFCLQYPYWKDELKYKTDNIKSQKINDMPRASGLADQTREIAVRRAALQRKCDMIEKTALEAAGDIAEYLIENVTHEDKGFSYLRMVMGMPIESAQFYRRRRNFFLILNKKHDIE